MIHFLGELGIDFSLLLGQVVNFGLLLLLLWKFLYHPIIERIEADELALEQVQKQKIELEKETERLTQLRVTHEVESKRVADTLIHDAENIAHEIRERARDEARKEKDAVIAQIRSRLENNTHE